MKRSKVHEETTIDQYGEVTSKKSISVYESKPESYYVKVYMEHIQRLLDLTKAEIVVFFLLSRHINYKNTVHITVGIKNRIAEKCGFTLGTVNKCVVGLHTKKWLFNVSRGTYLVNPEFIGKGSWKNISELRMNLFEENGFLSLTPLSK